MKFLISLVVFCVLAIVALVNPLWIVFAAIGVLAGMTIHAAVRWLRASKYGLLIVCNLTVVGVLGVLIFVISIPSLMESRSAAFRPGYFARYSLEVEYDASGPNWQITDQIEIHEGREALMRRIEEVEQRIKLGEASAGDLSTHLATDWSWLDGQMTEAGWLIRSQSDNTIAFENIRTLAVERSWLSPRSVNRIPLRRLDEDLSGICRVKNHGTLKLHAPRNVIGLTQPDRTQRETGSENLSETVSVLFDSAALQRVDGQPVVAVEVIHPLLQNSILAGLRQLGGVPLIHWFVVAVFAIFNEKIKSRVCTPIARALAHRVGIHWFEDSCSENPTPSEHPESHATVSMDASSPDGPREMIQPTRRTA